MNRSAVAFGYLLLTFASGAVVGGFGHWLYTAQTVRADLRRPRNPEEFRKRYLEEMETRLKLSQDQKEKLVVILDTTRTLYRQISDKHRPEYQAIHQHQVEQVRAILTDSQKPEYEHIIREHEERRKQRQR